MVAAWRLAHGGRVNRERPLGFRFDGRRLEGCAGDTLASALLANGVHLVGRSFKYHRPRGIVAAGVDEPNALVTIARDAARETPNLRATQVELYDGLEARSQNRWPSLAFDVAAVTGLLGPVIPAGFYYKTFMGPRRFGVTRTWSRVFEPAIRRASGLGRAPGRPDPDTYLNRYAHCDVLVIGAGPAGIAAALAASQAGATVMLCDEQAESGGSLLAENRARIDGKSATDWVAGALSALRAADARVLSRTTAFGYYADNFIGLAERLSDHLADCAPGAPRERLWQVRAREVVLATGAIERPLVFAGNDRPGILLADAARTYLHRYAVKPGRAVVVATACDSAYRAALDLAAAGVAVAALLDVRPRPPENLVTECAQANVPVLPATTVAGTRGRLRISGVSTERLDPRGAVARGPQFACDTLLTCGGWTPSVHLFSQSRGRLAWDARREAYLPGESAARERSAGACRGLAALAAIVADGHAAGDAAASAATRTSLPRHRSRTPPGPRTLPGRDVTADPASAADTAVSGGGNAGAPPTVECASSWDGGILGAASVSGRGSKRFVDLQNDVTVDDLELAVREGFTAIEHVKRYTTVGMATDQGKTSNLNALAIVARASNRSIPDVGLTTFRQPYTPVTFGTLAGAGRDELLAPLRVPPSHAYALAHNAVFEDVGTWRRARCFPRDGEDAAAAVTRECRAVRGAVGLLDASTLGKIEVTGADAAIFIERIVVNRVVNLAVGRCRYAVLLNDAGFVIDDGVVGRLAPDRFHMTTTTGGAAHVLHRMEDFLQTEWPSLEVWLTSVTEQWATFALQGPRARAVLTGICPGSDADPAALPHMAVIETTLCGVPARVFAVSFSGEPGIEINVPAAYGAALWQRLADAVVAAGGCVYGTDAMHVLRAEKGYVIVGQDTDGTVSAGDLGLGRMIAHDKPDFVGKRALEMPELARPDRRQLVGLLSEDPARVPEEGAQVTEAPDPPTGTPALGFVSSAYLSPTLGRSIALALVERGHERMGERLFVPMPEGALAVEVTSPVFYDPHGARVRG